MPHVGEVARVPIGVHENPPPPRLHSGFCEGNGRISRGFLPRFFFVIFDHGIFSLANQISRLFDCLESAGDVRKHYPDSHMSKIKKNKPSEVEGLLVSGIYFLDTGKASTGVGDE